jgi:uncharacterized sulfatase
VVRTPNIDRLADQGLAFPRGYSPVSLCRPSLMSIATGLLPHQHRVVGNDPMPFPAEDAAYDKRVEETQTLPRTLATRLGYTSFQTGKWWEGHYSSGGFTNGNTANSTDTAARPPQWSGSLPGYAAFNNNNGTHGRHGDWGLLIGRADFTTNNSSPGAPINYLNTIKPVTDFIDAQTTAGKPFLVWFAPLLPHDPHDPPTSMAQYYQNLGVDPWTAKYYANCERWDGAIGALMGYLDTKGIADNTIVIYCGDNGWVQSPNADVFLGSGNNAATSKSKQSPYDGGLRTPILVRWPNVINASNPALAPQVVKSPVSTTDIVPTILAAVGLHPTAEMRGVNLLNLAAVRARDTLFGECYQHDDTLTSNTTNTLRYRWALRDGWKLILRNDGSGPAELYQLYDYLSDPAGVAVDPFETNNRAAAQSARVLELTNAILTQYDPKNTLARRTDQSQSSTERLLPLAGKLGQTWTASESGYLRGIRMVVRPSGAPRAVTVELRALDTAGRPLGAVLSTATVPSDVFIADETRWFTFPFNSLHRQVPGEQLGVVIRPESGSGTFEFGYSASGAYAGGGMFFEGNLALVGTSFSWPNSDLDLSFQTVVSTFGSAARLDFSLVDEGDPPQARVVGDFPEKGMFVELLGSSDLVSWQLLSPPTLARDGLLRWLQPLSVQPKHFFKVRESLRGDQVTP